MNIRIMQYLPYAQERNRDQVVLGENYYGPAGERLPITNTFLNASQGFSQHARRARDPITWVTDNIYGLGSLGGALLVGPIVDTVGNLGTTAYNGYKRLYNYGADAYNNLADSYNNYRMQNRVNSLTGRKFTNANAPIVPTLVEVEKPRKFLQGVNGEMVAEIVDPNPTQIKIVPSSNTLRNVSNANNTTNLKKTIAKGLSSMVNNGKITGDVSKIQKLINLYNKVR